MHKYLKVVNIKDILMYKIQYNKYLKGKKKIKYVNGNYLNNNNNNNNNITKKYYKNITIYIKANTNDKKILNKHNNSIM